MILPGYQFFIFTVAASAMPFGSIHSVLRVNVYF